MASPTADLTGVKVIATEGHHTVALKDNGTVWSWGWNTYGQLGDGTIAIKSTPVQVMASPGVGLTGVKAIAAGYAHTIALKDNGTVWSWGYNYYGQLGDGTVTEKSTPVQVTVSADVSLTDVIAISAGRYHTIALKDDGTVWSWGDNIYGQLGNGTTAQRNTPVQVMASPGVGLTDVIAISARYDHTIALKDNGTVWSWGYNGTGQLGDGTTANKSTPVQVSGLDLFVKYAVTYDLNGGFGTVPVHPNSAAGATFTAASATGLTAPTGKQFKEWNTAANGSGTIYAAGATVTMPANALTLYAIWEDRSTGGSGGEGGGSLILIVAAAVAIAAVGGAAFFFLRRK
jgi:alpha-tubulin suppressor-like RCC1 family protein